MKVTLSNQNGDAIDVWSGEKVTIDSSGHLYVDSRKVATVNKVKDWWSTMPHHRCYPHSTISISTEPVHEETR